MGKGVNLALYARVVIQSITVKVTKFWGILLYGKVLKRHGDNSFHKSSSLEGY